MEKGLQKNNRQETTLIPSANAIRISNKLLDVNMLVGFPMSGEDIVVWSIDLDRLCEYEELLKLPFLMDCFKKDEIIWDRTLGIQNIFRGLRQIEKTETGFKVLKAIW